MLTMAQGLETGMGTSNTIATVIIFLTIYLAEQYIYTCTIRLELSCAAGEP